MEPGEKKESRIREFVNKNPVQGWSSQMYTLIDKRINCNSQDGFTARVKGLLKSMEVLGLNDYRLIIEGCRAFERSTMSSRREINGKILFSQSDRIRIFGDRLEEVYGEFRRPTQAA